MLLPFPGVAYLFFHRPLWIHIPKLRPSLARCFGPWEFHLVGLGTLGKAPNQFLGQFWPEEGENPPFFKIGPKRGDSLRGGRRKTGFSPKGGPK